MTHDEVLAQLRLLLVERLRFDPQRATRTDAETLLPKGVEGSLGLDSLDFIELSAGIEERFGLVIDETENLANEFRSLGNLSRFVIAKLGHA